MKVPILLSKILRQPWCISEDELVSWLPIVNKWIAGEHEAEIDVAKLNYFVSDSNGKVQAGNYDSAPSGSIAIVSVEGPMLRESGWCNVGTTEIAQAIAQAAAEKNISGIVLEWNTGGGEVDAVAPLVEAITNAKLQKPVVSLVHEALSAGYWAASGSDWIVASGDLARTGSIGVFVKFANDQEYWKQKGIQSIEIYAPESDSKNLPIRKALEGDYKLIESDILSPIARKFQEAVMQNRNINTSDKRILSGRVFFANADGHDAIGAGLIDEIGTLQTAINKINQLNSIKQNNVHSLNTHSIMLDKTKIPALLAVLGFDSIEATDGNYFLSAEQIKKVQSEYHNLTGQHIMLAGVSFAEDGSAIVPDKALYSLNAVFTKAFIEANGKKDTLTQANIDRLKAEHNQQIKDYESRFEAMKKAPEEVATVPPVNQSKSSNVQGKFVAPVDGLNRVDDLHPWNAAALAIANGDRRTANFMIANGISKDSLDTLQDELRIYGASTLDISQMNTILGARHVQNVTEIQDMLVKSEEISNLFPWRSTGIKDELPNITLYVDEFLQPRNASWAEKGGFEIQAEKIKVKNWQVSHRYEAAQMWGFIESWLAEKTMGTDPFQQSLVNWLTQKMMVQIFLVERPRNAIKGVYVTPASGVAGKSINSMDGILKNLKDLVRNTVILPHYIGKGDYAFLDGAGNVNKNHVYFKIQDLIKLMPSDIRDAFMWDVLISKQDDRERTRFMKEVIATNANYAEVEKAENYDNFTIKPVPYWPDGLIVITLPRNILQGYREKNDDNRVYFDKEKRDTIVFMDGGYVIAPVLTGKKFATAAELVASEGYYQRIFTNAEFGAFTPVELAAGDTTPSVAVHTVLKTVANAGATVITTFDDAQVGDIIYLIGGSNTNASTIASNNANFVGLTANITFNEGVIAKFKCTAANTFLLLDLLQQQSMGAVMFDVDDTTPDVGDGYLFITNPENTGATAITDFENAPVGKEFTVLGGGGTNASTIAKAGKFAYISGAWTATLGESIKLMKRSDGFFIEL